MESWGRDTLSEQTKTNVSMLKSAQVYPSLNAIRLSSFDDLSRNARSPLLSYCSSCCLDLPCDRLFALSPDCVCVMEREAFKQGWADASMLANCYDAV